MNLYEIVFSATGRTQKVVDVISSEFGKKKIGLTLANLILKVIFIIFPKTAFVLLLCPFIMGEFLYLL